jgi:hypothetical protein
MNEVATLVKQNLLSLQHWISHPDYWHMPLHANSVQKTAFTLPGLGQYKLLMSPMGLIGCPESFQRLMEKLTDNFKNVIVYINDLLVNSQTHEEGLNSMELVMQRLE